MAVSEQTNYESAPEAAGLPPDEIIFGRSPAMASIRQKVQKVLGTNIPILIQGENGTGKGLLAQYIHLRSTSSVGAFVKVNCAAIPGALLESELFGYEKGSFTDANTSKPGYVEIADRGTLFLDEIADLDLSLQAKILQLMQDGQFSRIGGQDRHAQTRIICATSRQLERQVAAGTFRADLFYRINVIHVKLPLLRDRSGDIPMLAKHFLTLSSARFQLPAPALSREVLDLLQRCQWPGNIRELENCMARCVILGPEEALGTCDREPQPVDPEEEKNEEASTAFRRITERARKELERDVIMKTLENFNWNRRKTAEALKISYRTLLYKLRKLGLTSMRERKAS